MLARVHSCLLLTVGVIFMYTQYYAIENSMEFRYQSVCVCVCAHAQVPVGMRVRPFSTDEGARAGNWDQNR